MDLGLFGLSLGRLAYPLRPDVFAQVMVRAANGAGGRARTEGTELFWMYRAWGTLDQANFRILLCGPVATRDGVK
jgi:hypothetical protein